MVPRGVEGKGLGGRGDSALAEIGGGFLEVIHLRKEGGRREIPNHFREVS